jgi:uncharacterized protein
MMDEQALEQVIQRIVAVAEPSRVILFGSYGRGEATKDSDLDILVIQPQVQNRGEEMVRLRQAIGPVGVGVDILVYPEAEYKRRSQVPGTLPYWADKEGKIVYAATGCPRGRIASCP